MIKLFSFPRFNVIFACTYPTMRKKHDAVKKAELNAELYFVARKDMKILNISFHRVGSEPKKSRLLHDDVDLTAFKLIFPNSFVSADFRFTKKICKILKF